MRVVLIVAIRACEVEYYTIYPEIYEVRRPMSVSLQVNVMSTVPLQQDSRFDVLINCRKVQMASLISISHFSFFSFCHS